METPETPPKRSEWGVNKSSVPWRLYQYWRHLGGNGPQDRTPPGRIDLCHFTRVVVFWVWLRWFFCSRFEPWAWVLGAGAIATIAWLWTTWTDVMNEIAIWFGVGVALVLLCVGIIYLLERYTRTERWASQREALARNLERFATWSNEHVFEPAFSFVERVAPRVGRFLIFPLVWRINPLSLIIVGVFASLVAIWPDPLAWIYLWIAVGFAILVAVIAAGLGLKTLLEGHAEARAAREPEDEEPTKPKKERKPSRTAEVIRIAWMYLRAKKQRICPFIVPED